jgi:hypothetical protein
MYHVEALITLDEQQMHHVPQEFFVLRETYVLNSCNVIHKDLGERPEFNLY